MILYPFQPDLPFGYSVTGFDEEKKTPGAELYLLPPGAQIPAEFTGGAIFHRILGIRSDAKKFSAGFICSKLTFFQGLPQNPVVFEEHADHLPQLLSAQALRGPLFHRGQRIQQRRGIGFSPLR